MAKTLFFRGQQFGDQIVSHLSDHQPATQRVVLEGLLQSTAAINADTRNLVYAKVFKLYLKAADEDALDLIISNIQQYAGLRGVVQVYNGATLKIQSDDQWLLVSVARPNTRDAFGGRFVDDLELRFEGVTPLQYS